MVPAHARATAEARHNSRQALTAFDEALRRTVAMAIPLGSERIEVGAADDRILAVAAVALRSSPSTAVSAMDGFAVRSIDIARDGGRLKIVGKSFAGAGYDGSVKSGECVRIFTGAPLPAGTDRVIVQEVVTISNGNAVVSAQLPKRTHVREAGSDFRCGDILIADGQRLRPQHLIAAAGGDLEELEVFRRPRVQIVCCGDELVAPGQARTSPHRIPESISVGVAALVRRFGGDVTGRTVLRDDLPALTAALRAIAPNADAVVMIGGASVGERDYAKAAFEALGLGRTFANVAMKPGKPVWLGELSGTPVLGLPGNPTSALVCARLFLAPLIAGLGGQNTATALAWRTARCSGIERCVDRDLFVRATSCGNTIHPLSNQDSANQKALADADILVRVRPGPPTEEDAEIVVEVVDL